MLGILLIAIVLVFTINEIVKTRHNNVSESQKRNNISDERIVLNPQGLSADYLLITNNTQAQERIISRADWFAIPSMKNMKRFQLCRSSILCPVPYVIIHSTGTPMSGYEDLMESCTKHVQSIQSDHFNEMEDIAYNFLICKNGMIFEGRGWYVEGAREFGKYFENVQLYFFNLTYILHIYFMFIAHSSNSYHIALIGEFENNNNPSYLQLCGLRTLLENAVRGQKLHENYVIYPHSYFKNTKTEDPGERVISKIQDWDHYYTNYDKI